MEQKKKKIIKVKKEKHKIKKFLDTAGYYVEVKDVNYWIMISALFVGIFEVIYSSFYLYGLGHTFFSSTIFIVIITPFVIGLFYLLIWLVFLFYLDVRTLQRKQKIEEVLPDFLQLTAANIRAGMPIDQSLWYAVRPRFGVLANEIEQVAKGVMSGDDLNIALKDFSEKYDSDIVKRSMSLLLVGMEAGGEVGELLNQISVDIQDNRLMKKEMIASVQTYVIFITFATIIAAPILMGLSAQLLEVVTKLTSHMDFGSAGNSVGVGFSPGGGGIKLEDFKIFAYLMLSISSLVSAMLIAIIKKGRIMSGLKYIPQFIIVAVIVFWLATFLFGKLMAGLSV